MPNMNYCRFENTLRDLQDCYDHLGDRDSEMSESEKGSREELIELCKEITEEFDEED